MSSFHKIPQLSVLQKVIVSQNICHTFAKYLYCKSNIHSTIGCSENIISL